jgi:murein peptide amidase A
MRGFGLACVLLALSGALMGIGARRVVTAPSPEPQAPAPQVRPPAEAAELDRWCSDTRAAMRQMNWRMDPCAKKVPWRVGGHSVEGRPLVYAEFGDPASTNTTLVMTMVHGDEITPLYVGIGLANWLMEHRAQYAQAHVIIAPLVNPDGFFHKPRTRGNARGVDVNRNFRTHDWQAEALREWKAKFNSDPRRFPGSAPSSEPETLFQEDLIHRDKPQKILSVHAPLNVLDYDGPTPLSLTTFPREYVQECLRLRRQLKAVSTGFFPGSLGNYAGREMGIPTITLELPSANAKMAYTYWRRFQKGIDTMIDFKMPSYAQSRAGRSGS